MFKKLIEALSLFGNPLWPTKGQVEQAANALAYQHYQTGTLAYQLFEAYGCADEQYNWSVAERLLGL